MKTGEEGKMKRSEAERLKKSTMMDRHFPFEKLEVWHLAKEIGQSGL